VGLSFDLDLGPLAEQLRAELLAELRTELHREARRWPGWLDLRGASAYTTVPVSTLRKAIARRELAVSQSGPGGRVYVAREQLDRWMRGER
jgi:hypothetical protein